MMDSSEIKGLVCDMEEMEKMEVGGGELKNKGHHLANTALSTCPVDLRHVAVGCLLFLGGVVMLHRSSAPSSGSVPYKCPATVRHIVNNEDESFDHYYSQTDKQNATAFLENFRDKGYDAWGKTYQEVKSGMVHFKKKYFIPYIQSGQSIYESASGLGLNLYMTLEILEEAGITDIVVYGNEYMNVSTQKSNMFFDKVDLPRGATKGKLCTGDSADLFFVPSESFDLVYTGYISPILDPLGFDYGDLDDDFGAYKKVCEGAKAGKHARENKDVMLVRMAQQKQDAFYGQWVSEMIRIAKPGSAVIVEQISRPYCNQYADWGGVDENFWVTGVQQYGWDIDPNSIEFEKDVLYKDRYHAFMRKNEKKEE